MFDNIEATEISLYMNSKLNGSNILVTRVSSISNVVDNCISFVDKSNYIFDQSKRALIIAIDGYEVEENSNCAFLFSSNPRLDFAKIINKFFYKKEKGISSKAFISEDAIIGNNCYIGHNVIIEREVIIGNNSYIEHNSTILKNVIIGNDCCVGANCVIGNDGLGTAKDEKKIVMIRHLGKVIINDNVEIGASSTIGRGTIDDTIIEKGTKIGPQVNIGHNSIIGENCQIAGRTHISGSVKIGNSTQLWANCTIKDGIKIGNSCIVGIGAVVTKNIQDNVTVIGLEALKLRNLVKFKKDNEYK